MAKKKAEKPQRILTPHQISRWEQQKRRQRVIMVTGVFIIAAVLAIVAVGWFLSQYQPLQETALEVNGTEFKMDFFVGMLKIEGSFRPQTDLSQVADITLENIQRNELIRQGALELGASVTEEEIEKELENNDLPDEETYRALVGTQLLIQRLLDGHFSSLVPVNADQRQVMAMMLESEAKALEVRDRLRNGEDFGKLAEEMSMELYSKDRGGDLGWMPRVILQDILQPSIVDAIFSHPIGELSQPIYDEETQKEVGYWLVRVMERNEEEDETDIQFMLLSSEDEAQKIREQLEAGTDWGDLAVEHSQADGVETNRGDYQISEGMAAVPIDEFVYVLDAEIGVISEPLRDEDAFTKGGYWLIEVLDQDSERRIDTGYRDYLQTKAFDEWVASLIYNGDNQIVNYLDEERKAWAVEQARRS